MEDQDDLGLLDQQRKLGDVTEIDTVVDSAKADNQTEDGDR